jgi:transcriptional regulator with XRE-family HTH domain
MTDKELGNNIRKIRELKGFSQQYVAEKVRTSQKNLSRIETGQISPMFKLIIDICSALEVELVELLEFDERIVFNNYIQNQHGGEFKAYNNTDVERIEALYKTLLDEKERAIQILLKQKK